MTDDHTPTGNTPQEFKRASLRGTGRRILLGNNEDLFAEDLFVDVPLSPEETQSLYSVLMPPIGLLPALPGTPDDSPPEPPVIDDTSTTSTPPPPPLAEAMPLVEVPPAPMHDTGRFSSVPPAPPLSEEDIAPETLPEPAPSAPPVNEPVPPPEPETLPAYYTQELEPEETHQPVTQPEPAIISTDSGDVEFRLRSEPPPLPEIEEPVFVLREGSTPPETSSTSAPEVADNEEAIPRHEEDARRANLEGLNRVVQGDSALLIPHAPEEMPPPEGASMATTRHPLSPAPEEQGEAIPPHETTRPAVNLNGLNRVTQGETVTLIPDEPEAELTAEQPASMAPPPREHDDTAEAIPHHDPDHQVDLSSLNRAVQGNSATLIPGEPEGASTAEFIPQPIRQPVETSEPDEDYRMEPGEGTGGIIRPDDVIEAVGSTIESIMEGVSPLDQPPHVRVGSEELFDSTQAPDPTLLYQLVSDYRLNELWDMIEALQEDIIEFSTSDRRYSDIYQQELLRAGDLLLQGRENYDDARAIVYRVRTDLKRDRKIQSDSQYYRPLLLYYFAGWGIALLVLALLTGLVHDVTETLEVEFFARGYVPAVLGAFGGLLTAYLTLHKHTTVRRDFDPDHIPWYLFAPVVGGLMGFLTFLLLMAGIETTVSTSVLEDENGLSNTGVVMWLLAFLAGMNQNVVVNVFRNRSGNDTEDSPSPRGAEKASSKS